MEGKVLKMNNIYKISGSAKINKSAENPATANTLVRWSALEESTQMVNN